MGIGCIWALSESEVVDTRIKVGQNPTNSVSNLKSNSKTFFGFHFKIPAVIWGVVKALLSNGKKGKSNQNIYFRRQTVNYPNTIYYQTECQLTTPDKDFIFGKRLSMFAMWDLVGYLVRLGKGNEA